MEFPGITTGGGFAGTGGESSSFRYGTFDRIVNRIEVVLTNGSIVTASETENSDLFAGSAGAFGTLGLITLLEVQLIEAKPYVQLQYHPVSTVQEAVDVSREQCKLEKGNQYVDGILFYPAGSRPHNGMMIDNKLCLPNERRPYNGVIITGTFVDAPSSSKDITRYWRAQDPWYYDDVQKKLDRISWAKTHSSVTTSPGNPTDNTTPEKPLPHPPNSPDDFTPQQPTAPSPTPAQPPRAVAWTDTLPFQDYLFRYDRGAFWCGRYAFSYFHTPFNRLTRLLLDPLMRTRALFRSLHSSGHISKCVIQDLAIPASRLETFIDFSAAETGIWPLWLCPLKPDSGRGIFQLSSSERLPEECKRDLWVNVGLWGTAPQDLERAIKLNRRIEDVLGEVGGFKWLYSQTFYSEQQFWRLYDREAYEALRKKYGAEGLPDAWAKVKTDEEGEQRVARSWRSRWPVAGLIGVKKALLGGKI